jgi:hypothetical protein
MNKTEKIETPEYNFGYESWKIGKMISLLHQKKRKVVHPLEAFTSSFPTILKDCKGDKNKEAVLFFSIQTFSYGYRFPGFNWDYVEIQSNKALSSSPGDSSRSMIF